MLIGDGAEHGGGGERRRRCSGKGSTARGVWLASWGQGEANQGVVVVGVVLRRRVDGGQSSPELEKGCGCGLSVIGTGQGYL